jgi:hypothetical protein
MSVNTRTFSVTQAKRFTEHEELSRAKMFAQYTVLDELPGLIFGLMTMLYIVSSLFSLA